MSKTEDKATGQEVAVQGDSNLPAYLQGQAPQKSQMTGIDANDLVLPRIKLLQAISTEVEAFENAKAGLFWHNVMGEPIGPTVDFVVASFRKKYLLMAPLGDARKVMARAEDGINWTPPNGEFRVKLKGVKEEQTWKTAPTVAASGLAKWGSSIAGDENSKPAAVLVYEFLVYLPDFPHYSPIILSLARSQIVPGKDLISKIVTRENAGQPLQAQRFRANVIEQSGDEGPFKNYQFVSNGFATEQEFARTRALAEQFAGVNFRAEGEEDLVEGDAARSAGDGKPKTEEY